MTSFSAQKGGWAARPAMMKIDGMTEKAIKIGDFQMTSFVSSSLNENVKIWLDSGRGKG